MHQKSTAPKGGTECPHKRQTIKTLRDGYWWRVCDWCQQPLERMHRVEWDAEKPLPDPAG
jgi:hypothetical protein